MLRLRFIAIVAAIILCVFQAGSTARAADLPAIKFVRSSSASKLWQCGWRCGGNSACGTSCIAIYGNAPDIPKMCLQLLALCESQTWGNNDTCFSEPNPPPACER